MKKFLSTLLFISIPIIAIADGLVLRRAIPGSFSAANTSDITFYWNMDSVTTGISPQKGSGTITIGSAYTLTSGVVGTGGTNNNNTSSATNTRISFSTTTNIDMSKGRVGFYYCQMETGAGEDGDIIYGNGTTASNPKFYLQNINGTNTFFYKDKSINIFNALTVGTTYFLEVAWDSVETTLGAPCKAWVDGAVEGTCTAGSTGVDPAPTSIRMGGIDANTNWCLHDQLIISSDPLRNINTIKNQTSF